MPNSNPRAYVTVLPPRPVDTAADLGTMIERLTVESRGALPIEATLGEIDFFRATSVIYVCVVNGERKLRALHENLNSGQLEYGGPYPYHPHGRPATVRFAHVVLEILHRVMEGNAVLFKESVHLHAGMKPQQTAH